MVSKPGVSLSCGTAVTGVVWFCVSCLVFIFVFLVIFAMKPRSNVDEHITITRMEVVPLGGVQKV